VREYLQHISLITGEQLEIEFENSKIRRDVKHISGAGYYKLEVRMLKDIETGIIFMDHEPPIDYSRIESLSYWGTTSLEVAREKTKLDDERRFEQFRSFIVGKDVLDFGCGNGGFLNLCRSWANKLSGHEIQPDATEALKRDGLHINGIEGPYDTVTMFHVLEHLTNPLETLQQLKAAIRPGGHIIIEVPNARDFLLFFLESPEFKAHTYTSEYHTVLYTEETLRKLIELAGFKNVTVEGFQRYSINNHLHWLKEKKPGGMRGWDFLLSPMLKSEYCKTMQRLGMTDTLICIAEV
jgi:2-polyprenyl-3-methyl-5-hydroxy-6-metoxy-1,4-benzoquinol methylase